ncbi:MAG: dihydrodipicolinate synthase family protein [Bryobacteraceae bacterium]|nr:dihydrodipicolinate synthase family protein [Bryobacteraceae bacterium]
MSRYRVRGGVIAAVLLPRDEEGRPAWSQFEHLVGFLRCQGLSGLCINGATGEYVRASPEERRTAVALARDVAGNRCQVIAGCGAASTDLTLRLVAEAEAAGADAHLVPPPHFFDYGEDDLAEFYGAVARSARRPVLIYRLPCYLSDVGPGLAERLLRQHEIIEGIKDSSGQLGLLEHLSSQPDLHAYRFVGNDAALPEALRRGLCDGVISGVAGVLPELITALWEAGQRGDAALLEELGALLAEAVARIDPWPAPIGLQILAGIRGLCTCLPAVPLAERRKRQAEELRRWFEPWWEAFLRKYCAVERPAH